MDSSIYFVFLIAYFLIVILQASDNRYGFVLRGICKFKLHYLIFFLGLFVAFRPVDVIPDSFAYFMRYYFAPETTTFSNIVSSDSFYRGTTYSMSIPVNLLFYVFSKMHIPYFMFVCSIIFVEASVYMNYAKRIFDYLSIHYSQHFLFANMLVFYSFRYQFVAFAQGICICFAMPILYYLVQSAYKKAFLLGLLATTFHVAGLFLLVIIITYMIVPRLQMWMYALLWCFLGILIFLKLGTEIGHNFSDLTNFFIDKIVESSPIYNIYAEEQIIDKISLTGILFWVLCGILILTYNGYKEYWKIININFIALLLASLFSLWPVVHRFTDIAKIYMPIAIVIYMYEARSAIKIDSGKEKPLVAYSTFILGFLSALRLLKFLS